MQSPASCPEGGGSADAMPVFLSLISLGGAVALLLWGTRMVQTGVQRAFGARLRGFLARALGNRGQAFLAGIGVTALLQSSTATGLMVTAFAAEGLVGLMPALSVMLGANLGTTLIVQLLSFDVTALSPALILAGFLLFRRNAASLAHDLGRAIIGLGLMLLALHQLLLLFAPVESAPALRLLFRMVGEMPGVALLLAAVLAWALHSSVAAVLLIMSLAEHGVLPLPAALAMVVGANLGSALNPLLEGMGRADPAGRRLPMGNLLNRLLGLALAMPLLAPLAGLVAWAAPDPGRGVALFHTAFNLALALLFLPLLGPYARLLQRLLPARQDPADPSRPRYLDGAAQELPAVALAAAGREALRLADLLEDMLRGARAVLERPEARLPPELAVLEAAIDRLNVAIKAYLAQLDTEAMDAEDHRRLQAVLLFTTHLEQAADVVQRGLLPHAARPRKRGLPLPREAQAEILGWLDRLRGNLRVASALLMTEDARAARLLAEEKAVFRDMEAAATGAHFARLRDAGRMEAEASALQLDLLRDLKLVNSHVVAAAAYPLLERDGALLSSRVALVDES